MGRSPLTLFAASNEMAERIRRHDWTATKLGPIETWPQTLVAYVSLILELPTPAIIFWGDDQTQIYNDGYALIMGPRHPRYLGATYRECWPDTYPLIYPWMRNVLDQGEVVRVEATHIPVTRYGFEEEAYFTFTFNALRDDDGRIAGIYQPVTEVTDAVLSQRRSETLRTMAAPSDARGALDIAIAALSANASDVPFAAIFERDGERGELQLVGRVGDKDPAGLVAAARHAVDAGPARLDDAYVLPLDDARRGAVVFGISPRLHFNDRYRGFFEAAAAHLAGVLASRDAMRSAERHAQVLADLDRTSKEATQRERQRLYAALMNTPASFCVLAGEALVIEIVNYECLAVWGRDESIVGMPLVEALPELRDQPFPSLLRDVLRTGVPIRQQGVLARLDPGQTGNFREVYYDFAYEPMRDASGTVDSVIVFAVDVTHQVLAQRAIESALDDARRANQAKDEFLAMLGHELRNPMAPIVTALEMMQLHRDRDVSREREIIERQTRHLVRLVDDLLDISRITRGAFELSCTRIDLGDIIARAVETAAPRFSAKHHALRVEVPPGLVVDADSDRMHQVFSNVLTNAAKYTPDGGAIEVTAHRDGTSAVVVVRDNGAGIAADILPRVFDMFVQERQDIERAQGGLGLGLAIVRAIVRRHGGDVTAFSDGKGKGSVFEIRVPLAHGPNLTPDATPRQAFARSTASRRVLIVDDNVDAAVLLAEAVQLMGHVARITHDGASALALATTFEPEIALLDIGLPVMSGYELARHLRAQQPSVHIIAITGYGQDSDRDQTARAGFVAHLVKPVDVAQLATTIDRLTAS